MNCSYVKFAYFCPSDDFERNTRFYESGLSEILLKFNIFVKDLLRLVCFFSYFCSPISDNLRKSPSF